MSLVVKQREVVGTYPTKQCDIIRNLEQNLPGPTDDAGTESTAPPPASTTPEEKTQTGQ